MSETIEHKCGLVGIVDPRDRRSVAKHMKPLMEKVEHRGPGGWGIAFHDEHTNDISFLHGTDKVSKTMRNLRRRTHAAIGHTLYKTTPDAFPHPYEAVFGNYRIAVAFNGNIPETSPGAEGRKFLLQHGFPCETRADTEMLAKLLVWHINDTRGRVDKAFKNTREFLADGSYNVVLIAENSHVHAFRDPQGRHPLVFGQTGDGLHALASESSALRRVWRGADEVALSEVRPGMHIEIGPGIDTPVVQQIFKTQRKLCEFEYAYFSNRLSKIDGTSVYRVRTMSGEFLARQDAAWLRTLLANGCHPIVVGVPDSSKVAADGYADEAHLPRVDALLRNPEVDRTFIADEAVRNQMLEEKFEIDYHFLNGKDVVLIDDSLVRGRTMQILIRQMRNPPEHIRREIEQATGKPYSVRIHVRFAYPPVTGSCFYGINFPSVSELLVPNLSGGWSPREGDIPDELKAKVAAAIGADTVEFLRPADLRAAIGREENELCGSCHTTRYHSQGVQDLYDLQVREP